MLVKVAAGVILRNDSVFIALRQSNQHQGGLWEFPGGKCEPSEAVDVALVRELKEECGISVTEHSFLKRSRMITVINKLNCISTKSLVLKMSQWVKKGKRCAG